MITLVAQSFNMGVKSLSIKPTQLGLNLIFLTKIYLWCIVWWLKFPKFWTKTGLKLFLPFVRSSSLKFQRWKHEYVGCVYGHASVAEYSSTKDKLQ